MPSPSNQTSGEPEVPPDVPPDYADAYLAGFRRGLSGFEPDAPSEHTVQEPLPDAVAPPPAPVAPSPASVPPRPAAVVDQPVADRPGEAVLDEEPTEEPTQDVEVEAEAPLRRGKAELEWLFDRRESGPPGWTVAKAPGSQEQSTGELRTDSADRSDTPSGATSVAGEGPKSPWPLLGAFVVVLLLLMLLAYLGGMAFSTIMDR